MAGGGADPVENVELLGGAEGPVCAGDSTCKGAPGAEGPEYDPLG